MTYKKMTYKQNLLYNSFVCGVLLTHFKPGFHFYTP